MYSSKINTSDPETLDQIFEKFTCGEHPTIDKEEIPGLESEISEEEVFAILTSFQDNKSPGTDGLTKEFYVYFWESLKTPLINSFKHSLNTGLLSIDQRKGIITLIPKKDKDTIFLKNWRPLTILNLDYKILAKLLAYRLKNLLPNIIHPDQTGFVHNWYIGCNINRLLNAIDYCKDNSINGMLISIDFAKAFDSMEWSFVYRAMAYFGFPEKYINWVKILYNNIESCIVNDGHISRFFKPTRGVRQGCPMSPYLFIIGAELMARYIRTKESIPPIKIYPSSTAVSQYADDTTIITHRSKVILLEVFDILNEFAEISGLQVNKSKTQILLIGPDHRQRCSINDVCSVTDSVYILGIHVTCNKVDLINKNYVPILDSIRHLLNMWSQRYISLFGKIEVIKTLIISKLVYVMSLLPTPTKDFLDQIEKNLMHFVWNNKPAKIRKSILKTQTNMGGAGMVDLKVKDMSLKMGWLKKLIEFGGCWKDYLISKIQEMNPEYFIQCNIKTRDIPFTINEDSIWKDVLNYWCKYHYKSVNHIHRHSDVANMNIWWNSNIKIGNKLVFWKTGTKLEYNI